MFAVLPLATDPVALTVKTPDCVELAEGVVNETVGLAMETVNGKLAQLLCLPVVSIMRTSSVWGPFASVVASNCQANSPDCLMVLYPFEGLRVRRQLPRPETLSIPQTQPPLALAM